jgi:haloalkane dehalogenase
MPMRTCRSSPCRLPQLLAHALQRALDVERGRDRAARRVLERERRAEKRHDAVAGELDDGAFVAVDLVEHVAEAAVHERAHLLGVDALGDARRADDVGEEHGHELPLAFERGAGRADARREVRGVYDDGAGTGGVARAGAPQLSQKTASARSAAPQLAQASGTDKAVPQPRQNRASSRFSLPQRAHSTAVSYVAREPIASRGLVTSEASSKPDRRRTRMETLRTPDERFANLPGYPFAPHYTETDGLRIHYVDEGPRDAAPVLMLHGEPSWSYLYRKMIPIVVAAGHRASRPTWSGFGRSDKPVRREDYTYQRHVDWLRHVLTALDLRNVTLVCQDWGGLLGLRLVADHPERFARVVTANTFLPTGDVPAGKAFLAWKEYSQTTPDFRAGGIVRGGTVTKFSPDVEAAYDAPFPGRSLQGGRPAVPDAGPRDARRSGGARQPYRLGEAFDLDQAVAHRIQRPGPVTRGGDTLFQERIPGAKGQPHVTIEGGGHFCRKTRARSSPASSSISSGGRHERPRIASSASSSRPYSVKVRSYFRYKRIPHEWVVRSIDKMDEYNRYAKLPLIPLVVAPDDTAMQDSTPIIEKMEARVPEPALQPADPALAFLSALVEEYGDEWGNKPMFHYRWFYEADATRRASASRAR